MQFDKVYTVKKEISKEQFLRRLMIKLSSASDTPVGITKSNFGEVKESVREAILCKAHVESDYTASIGYDRQEEYWDKEKKYNSTTKEYYYVDVKKTRTVTDWQPHSGHIGGDATCIAFNEEPSRFGYSEHDELRKVLLSINDENVMEKGEATITHGGLETVKRTCAFYVELGIRYPGDHHKDERTNATVDVLNTECYRLPFYEVDFEYDGKTYHASGFACNESLLQTEYPPNNVDIKAQATTDTKKDKTSSIALWSTFGGLFLLAFILCVVNVAHWLIVFPALAFGAAIFFHVTYYKKFNSRIRSLAEDNIKVKLEDLQNQLKAHEYDELSAEELELFDTDKGASASERKLGKRSGKVWPIVLGAIGMVILLIMSIVMGVMANNRKIHSPEQISVDVVNITKDSDYNRYYVYFEYEITAGKKVGIDSIKIITYVNDKNGNELGNVTSTINNMNLDAGDTKTYSIYFQNNSLTNNAFFTALYNGNVNDFSFRHEIVSISFSDGEYYSQGY